MEDISRPDGIEPENSPGSRSSGVDDPMPVTAIVCGRGRVGKTVIANTIVQFCRQRSARLEVWNSDQQNQTHSLSLFHAGALRPATDNNAEEKRPGLNGISAGRSRSGLTWCSTWRAGTR